MSPIHRIRVGRLTKKDVMESVLRFTEAAAIVASGSCVAVLTAVALSWLLGFRWT